TTRSGMRPIRTNSIGRSGWGRALAELRSPTRIRKRWREWSPESAEFPARRQAGEQASPSEALQPDCSSSAAQCPNRAQKSNRWHIAQRCSSPKAWRRATMRSWPYRLDPAAPADLYLEGQLEAIIHSCVGGENEDDTCVRPP